MNRRSFLSAAITAATALAVDPERLLWTPTKTIFIPPAPSDYITATTGILGRQEAVRRWLEEVNLQIARELFGPHTTLYLEKYGGIPFRLTVSADQKAKPTGF